VLINSTVSGNSTAGNNSDGGGIYASFELFGTNLYQSTVTDNHVTFPSSNTRGGGVDSQLLSSEGSIIAGNTSASNEAPDVRGAVTTVSVNYSLIGNTANSGITGSTGTGNLLNVAPQLGPLADNGGPTLTHALLPLSPATDAGGPTFGPNAFHPPLVYDQRGLCFDRVENGRIDMGAFEVQTELPTPLGDYNRNGVVDAADYTTWRNTLGQTVPQYDDADGDGDGTIDRDDYDVWKAHYGETGPPQPIIRFAEFAVLGGPQLVLEIVGTGLNDAITVSSLATPREIRIVYQNTTGVFDQIEVSSATVNAHELASGLAFRGVYVRGLAGNDTLSALGLRVPAIIDAGAGNDGVAGGSEADLILGGRGADTLTGWGGRDLLVGGREADSLAGDAHPSFQPVPADDLLIAGEVAAPVDVAVLDAALAAWNGAGDYTTRVDLVKQSLIANDTVLDDEAVDTLYGWGGDDLFFAAVDTPSNNDVLPDFNPPQEQVEVTHPPIPASALVSEAVGAVFAVNDASIDYVRFIFLPELWSGSTKDAVTLEITLVELRLGGVEVHLQTLSLLLSAATLVSLNGGPGGTAVVDIDTTTAEVNAGSRVNVTTTLRGPNLLDGLPESFTISVDLEPVLPS
jgi:hypothetical protein